MVDQKSNLDGANEALKQITDIAKQLVTLAAAIIGAFVAAITSKLITVEADPTWILAAFFISMLLVIIFSFLLQLAIAGVHDAKSFPSRSPASEAAAANPSIYAPNVRLLLSMMLICFVVSMCALSTLVFF